MLDTLKYQHLCNKNVTGDTINLIRTKMTGIYLIPNQSDGNVISFEVHLYYSTLRHIVFTT